MRLGLCCRADCDLLSLYLTKNNKITSLPHRSKPAFSHSPGLEVICPSVTFQFGFLFWMELPNPICMSQGTIFEPPEQETVRQREKHNMHQKSLMRNQKCGQSDKGTVCKHAVFVQAQMIGLFQCMWLTIQLILTLKFTQYLRSIK